MKFFEKKHCNILILSILLNVWIFNCFYEISDNHNDIYFLSSCDFQTISAEHIDNYAVGESSVGTHAPMPQCHTKQYKWETLTLKFLSLELLRDVTITTCLEPVYWIELTHSNTLFPFHTFF